MGSESPSAPPYEELLTGAILSYLQCVCERYSWQVPVLDGRIDFVGIKRSYDVISIEAKIRNWRRALVQAQTYMLCSDKAYVALPERIACNALEHQEMFYRRGVGLMSIGESTQILLEARRSAIVVHDLRKHLLRETRVRRRKSGTALSSRIEALNEIEKLPRSDQERFL